MKKLAILFSGTGSNFAYIMKHLHQKEYEVVLAVTNNPEAKGKEIALEYNIPLVIIDSTQYSQREFFDKKLVETLTIYQPNLTILAGFMRILTPVFTSQIKAINLHPSLLPRHKGLHAIEKSYEDKFKEGGVTVHYVSSQLDAGKIIVQKTLPKKGLSFHEYDKQIRSIEKEALINAIKKILGDKNENI
jgi:phosphoribosylglycinamide formyltransferase-1